MVWKTQVHAEIIHEEFVLINHEAEKYTKNLKKLLS